jgi:hypothetical protein
MKFKTSGDLIQYIDDRYNLRRQEISALIDLLGIANLKKNKYQKEVLKKSAVTISYSHWEGFVKETSRSYLEYIKFISPNASSLSSNLLASIIHHHSKNNESQFDSINFYRKILTDPSYKVCQELPIEQLTSTHDNLNYKYLSEIALNIDMRIDSFDFKKEFIDVQLLANRNKFAHGDYNYDIDEQSAVVIAKSTIDIMKIFKDNLQNLIGQESYKK